MVSPNYGQESAGESVMPGLVPGIHDFDHPAKTWMAGTSPAMTAIAVWNGTSPVEQLPQDVVHCLAVLLGGRIVRRRGRGGLG